MRDRISFFGSWWQNVKEDIPEELQLTFLKGILGYAFDGTEPCFEDVLLRSNWRNIKPNIDSSNASMDGGKKGGRPSTAQVKNPPLKPPFKTPLSNPPLKPPFKTTLSNPPTQPPLSNPPVEPPPSMDKDKDKDMDMDKDMDNTPPCPPQGGEVSYDTLWNKDACAKSKKKETKTVKFVPPTVEDVQAYLTEKGITDVDAEAFVAFYESKGWMVGKNKMQRWRSAITTWRRNGYGKRNAPQPAPPPTLFGDMSVGTPAQRYEVPDIPAWD